jgi:uncharacterized protein YcbX
MSVVGTVESLWRYPVKSMRGEELAEVLVGFGGVQGDRLFAFHSSAARPDFPYFTGRQQNDMLRYKPRILSNEDGIEVETPDGRRLRIDEPQLIDALGSGVDPKHHVTLIRSDRAFADAYPVSIISLQTVGTLAEESATRPEKRRFRANIYVDLPKACENEFVGRSLRIGDDVIVSVAKRDSRCIMINLDPDTAEQAPSVLRAVAQRHEGTAGVYGSVAAEGVVRPGDRIELLD